MTKVDFKVVTYSSLALIPQHFDLTLFISEADPKGQLLCL